MLHPNDAAFRSCLVWLAALLVVIGLYTQSLKKVLATYLLVMFVIAGVLLPDWDFFDRPVSQWCSPISVDDTISTSTSTSGHPPHSAQTQTPPARFKIYPVRLIVYAAFYGFALYEWWMFISN